MAAENDYKQSFSPFRRLVIALNVGVIIAIVLAVVLMVNYLSRDYFVRLHVSTQGKVKLSPRTVKFLETMTNSVKITLYYDKEDQFYSTIAELLNEYRASNRHISLKVVDYMRDPGAAQALRTNYTFLGTVGAKNLIIFDGGDKRIKPVDGNALVQYVQKQIPNEKELEFTRKPTFFEGERAFTSALIAVTTTKPFKAYVLTGNGEHAIDDESEDVGYKKFATLLRAENFIQLDPLSLSDTNHPVPPDCNLLVIPGPRTRIEDPALQMIDQYLTQGGRLLVLFNFFSIRRGETGLEQVLGKWGVNVSTNVITDPDLHIGQNDVIVANFSNHPIVSPLQANQLRLHMILPRVISKQASHSPAADAPNVEEIAFSGPRSYVDGAAGAPGRPYPLMVAVEKGGVKGVVNERGTTRIVVVGDSIFLGNHQIESAANREFVGLAANWLLDRPSLVEGIGPRPISEYHLVMSNSQLQGAEWLLLGGMPGAVLLLGGVVWLRRRS